VQVASTRDALEADVECERLTDRGEVAFVVPADVGGQLWQRVMIGRYATFAEAERTVERLSEQLASWRP
jgi:septal ring-binding cell division protein DamX